MKVSLKDWGKGLNTDLLPSELAPGFWSAASNVVVRNGFACQADGISVFANASVVPYWLHQYQLTESTFRNIYASPSRVYSVTQAGVGSDITRSVEGVTISSITRVGTTATLTTATAHGRSTGNTVSVWGASPSQYNGTFVITVTGANTFTYTMASDPGASASPVGLYSYDGSTSDFTSDVDTAQISPKQFSGGVLNGIFIFNSPSDGLYYWADTSRLRKIPLSYKARVSRPFKNYIFQLGPTIGSTEYPYRVLWSSAADPGSYPSAFDPTATNDAGFYELADTGGTLMDCLPLGDQLIVYKSDGRYAFQYVGGSAVFSQTRLPGNDGLMYRGCVVNTPVGHVFLTPDKQVMLHSGGECRNLSAGRINASLRGIGSIHRSFLCVNPYKTEVWVCVVSSNSFPDKVYIWNWIDDAWGVKDLGTYSLTCGATGIGADPSKFLLYVSEMTASKIGYVDLQQQKFNFDSTGTFDCYLERKGLDLGDADAMKTIHRSRWNVDGIAGGPTLSVYHGSSKTADGAVTYASPVTYTVGTTDYASQRSTQGRYLAVKLAWTTSSSGVPKVRSCDLDVAMGGKR